MQTAYHKPKLSMKFTSVVIEPNKDQQSSRVDQDSLLSTARESQGKAQAKIFGPLKKIKFKDPYNKTMQERMGFVKSPRTGNSVVKEIVKKKMFSNNTVANSLANRQKWSTARGATSPYSNEARLFTNQGIR